jgi:uncharacterized membrane protein YbaN (DUF454 family)
MDHPRLDPSPGRGTCDPDEPRLEIELDGRAGRLEVRDARLFGPSGRPLGGRLVEALCTHQGVRRAEVDSRTSTCRVDFDLASNAPAFMAAAFIDALRTASAGAGKRRRWRRAPRWSAVVAYRHRGAVSSWEVYDDGAGHLRLVCEGLSGGRRVASELADTVAGLDGVERCDVSLWSRRMTVVLDREAGASAGRTMGVAEAVLEGRYAAVGADDGVTTAAPPPVPVTGWKRLALVALGGGAFTLALVGLVVPGVPTVPFLLATSYYLGRSSPRLDGRLRRTPFFGPVLREWEGHAALSPASKAKLAGLTATLVAVTVLFVPVGPVSLGVLLLISSLSVYGVARTPTLVGDDNAPGDAPVGTPSPLPVF